MASESIGNPFNELVTNMIAMQFASVSTQETVNDSNTILTNANQELSEKWTSCPESNPGTPNLSPGEAGYEAPDPGYCAYYYLMVLTSTTQNPWPPAGSNFPTPTESQYPSGFTPPTSPYNSSDWNITDWVNTFLGTPNSTPNLSLSQFSSAFLTSVYGVYEQNIPSGNNPGTLGLISNVTNLVQAKSQEELQTGQNGISLLNSLQQHFESDQGPLSSATNTIIDGVNNYSTAMQSISP